MRTFTKFKKGSYTYYVDKEFTEDWEDLNPRRKLDLSEVVIDNDTDHIVKCRQGIEFVIETFLNM